VKPIIFHPKALSFIREEEPSIRKEIGEALRDLQKGISLGPPLSRPMPEVAAGAHELRVKGETASVRVFYCVKQAEAVIVFHASHKKTQKTPKRELTIAQQRLREVLHGKKSRT
jgi:phage-related protein